MSKRKMAPELERALVTWPIQKAARELRALLAVARAAERVLAGLDSLMNREPLVLFPERGYLVERSATLRSRLRSLSRPERSQSKKGAGR